jgi:hypothetical protein
MANRLFKITVAKWAEYNARADRNNYTWFRFQNDFFTIHKLFGLSDAQIILFQMILCEASKKNVPTVEISLDLFAAIRKTKMASIEEDLAELVSRGVLVVDSGHQLVASRHTTYERTNERDEHNTIAQSGDFADFWSKVPRKVGKEKTAKIYWRLIKTGVTHETLCHARDRYVTQLKADGTETKFILHGPTFIGRYKDFLEPDYGQAEDFSASAKPALDPSQFVKPGGAA